MRHLMWLAVANDFVGVFDHLLHVWDIYGRFFATRRRSLGVNFSHLHVFAQHCARQLMVVEIPVTLRLYVEFEKCDATALLATQQKWVHTHHNGVVHAPVIMNRFSRFGIYFEVRRG